MANYQIIRRLKFINQIKKIEYILGICHKICGLIILLIHSKSIEHNCPHFYHLIEQISIIYTDLKWRNHCFKVITNHYPYNIIWNIFSYRKACHQQIGSIKMLFILHKFCNKIKPWLSNFLIIEDIHSEAANIILIITF